VIPKSPSWIEPEAKKREKVADKEKMDKGKTKRTGEK